MSPIPLPPTSHPWTDLSLPLTESLSLSLSLLISLVILIFLFWFLFLCVYVFWFFVIIFVWILGKCEKHDKNGFSRAFSRTQPNTRKYFPKHFLECNQTLENVFISEKYFHLKIFYTQPKALPINLGKGLNGTFFFFFSFPKIIELIGRFHGEYKSTVSSLFVCFFLFFLKFFLLLFF